MINKYIAYEGIKFTLEWYHDEHGKSIALDYFKNLDHIREDKLLHLFKVMGDIGKINNIEKFRNEGCKIFAFKTFPDRFFCFFFQGSKIIITNAYEKQSDKMPSREFEKALNLKNNYEKRIKLGTYYEKKYNESK